LPDAAANGIKNVTKKNFKWAALTPYAYMTPTILVMTVLMLVPICMIVWYSMMDNVITNRNEPVFVGLANFIEIIKDKNFHDAVRHTVFFVAMSVIFHMLIAVMFAMMLNAKLYGPAAQSVFRVVYILPWVFTAAIIAVLWRLILSPNGVVNYIAEIIGYAGPRIEWVSDRKLALHSLIFINIWAGYPFFMVSILAGLQGISPDLYEAATVDGANGLQKFLHITIPQLKPIIISMAMLDMIWTTQQFSLVWMITGGGPVNATDLLGTYIYRLAFKKYQFSLASSGAVIILIVIMLMASFYVKHQKASD
jgi:multiple sugar transport system permease protein